MRDFLNEDELALLKETCISGQLEISKESGLSSVDIEHQAFKTGVVAALKECVQCRHLSSIATITEQSCDEVEDLLNKDYIFDPRKDQTIAFLRGKACQSRFILDRIITFRYVKKTLDPGTPYFIPGQHLAYIAVWRARDLGIFKNLKFDRNTVS